MSDPVTGGAVLHTGTVGEKANAIRKRDDRRHLLTAVAVALLLHILVVLGFYAADLLGIHEMTDWSGPVLVKIGAPEAPESDKPDPGPLPDQSEEPVPEVPDTPEPPADTPSEPQPESTPPTPETSPDATRPDAPAETGSGTAGEEVESPFAEASGVVQSQPARAKGNEDGNDWHMNFEGTDDEVGRTHSMDYVTSYMPLPDVLPPEIIEAAQTSRNQFALEDILKYWVVDPTDGMYVVNGFIEYDDRPFLWTHLKDLGYDIDSAGWREYAKGEVIVEFVVISSTSGAYLENIVLIQGTGNYEVNESIKAGLNRWNYYNRTDRPIKGRLTYTFDR